jgi:Family of unknown function (DUF6069)
MSTTTTTMTTTPAAEVAVRPHPVRRAALTSGAIAALTTTAVAAAADAAGVPLAIDGETIPLLGFAQLTLVGAVLGGLMVAALNRYSPEPRRWFPPVAVVLTALSCIPSVALPPEAATKIVLIATHVLAAVIIVPALARQTHR